MAVRGLEHGSRWTMRSRERRQIVRRSRRRRKQMTGRSIQQLALSRFNIGSLLLLMLVMVYFPRYTHVHRVPFTRFLRTHRTEILLVMIIGKRGGTFRIDEITYHRFRLSRINDLL